MTETEIKKLIDDTVTAAVLKLKAAGLLQNNGKSAYDKTEALLYQYRELCEIDQPYAKRLVQEIEAAMAGLKNEPYLRVIELYYFDRQTNVRCAMELECEERTARRARRKLVETLSSRLASEDFIRELLL